MKIIMLNTWGHSGPYQKRWEVLFRELERYTPDVLCLQEVFQPELVQKLEKKFLFSHVLKSYEAGLVLMTQFPISSHQILNYKAISPNEQQNRQALLVGLKIHTKEIVIANTHLSWKAEDESVRHSQVQELLQAIANQGHLALLAGDFNDVAGSKPIEEIRKAGYVDLYNLLHAKKPKITWDNQNPFIQTHNVKFSDRQIDFLFLHNKLIKANTIKKCEIIFNRPDQNGIYPSDHYGVLADLSF